MFPGLLIRPLLRQAVFHQPSPKASALWIQTRHNSFASPSKPSESVDQKSNTWTGVIANPFVDKFVDKINEKEATMSINELWAKRSNDARHEAIQRPPADPYAGRRVSVVGGDVASAYNKLNGTLRRNKVKAELRRAERHEKKGVKRRRLESERWRRQFANEVRKNVQLVTKIRNRGA